MRYYWMAHVKLSGVIEADTWDAALALAQLKLDLTPRDRWPAELLTVIPASEATISVPLIGTEAWPS